MQDVKNSTLTDLLVVDDELLIRTFMVQVLTEIGYLVRSAHDGFSALAEIRRGIPDLVLSDLNMPGMSGFELLSVIRKRFPSIRVIAMSGSFSGDEVPRGIAADAFYPKGSDIRSLLKIIERLPQPEWLPADRQPRLLPFGFSETGAHPPGNLALRSTARSVCDHSSRVLVMDSAQYARHNAFIATALLTSPSPSQ